VHTTFHTLSQSPAIAAEAGIDLARPSSIAKPQKAFAIAFAVLTAALAGCASGLGANTSDTASLGRIAPVDEGTVVGQPVSRSTGSEAGYAYTIRLPSGELVSVTQASDYAIPAGTPVLVAYGANARVIPQ
jgi:outer membrane lipoprotein SlyB